MNAVAGFLSDPVVQRLGWVLVHSLWQEALVAILLAAVLRGLRREAPRARYAAGCAAMILMLALPVVTYFHGPMERGTSAAKQEATTTQGTGERAAPDASTINGAAPSSTTRLSTTPFAAASVAMRRWAAHALGSLEHSLPRVLPWLVGVWFAGVLILSARLIGGWVLVQRLARDGTRPGPDTWLDAARRLASVIRVSAPVRILESTLVSVPTVVGFLRPAILLPAAALSGLEPRQIEMILAHELAHIRRHDALVNLAQTVVETLLFYHPAVWYVSRVVRAEREHCCDEIAVAACGDRATLARALLTMEEMRSRLAIAASGPPLQTRIRRLLAPGSTGPDRSGPERRSSGLAGGIVLASLLLVAITVKVAIPAQTEKWPATYAEFAREAREALARGDDAATMEIASHNPRDFSRAQFGVDGMELSIDLSDVMHRRYDAVFRPPDNIEPLIPYKRWSHLGVYSSFTQWVKSLQKPPNETDYYIPGQLPDSVVASEVRSPDGGSTLTIDLNLDGHPDLVFDGHAVRIGSGVAVAEDHAPDGKRSQWLLALPGVDPRHQARVMLYRDGDFYLELIDFDGDGKGNYGRTGCVPRRQEGQ
jgi:beta-lactamase regulating signal transducer with metallopeptidase domain